MGAEGPPTITPAELEVSKSSAGMRSNEPCTLATNDPSNSGLGHSGDPEEEEVIVLEEPPREVGDEPRVIRVPRMPTQKEIEAHSATHLPHEDWCEFCMAGRGRNKPHMKKKKAKLVQEDLVSKHSGVLGLCAFVNAFPYDVPEFVPDILMVLSDHLHDPQPIPVGCITVNYKFIHLFFPFFLYVSNPICNCNAGPFSVIQLLNTLYITKWSLDRDE